jgi:putative DNA primase/helicase
MKAADNIAKLRARQAEDIEPAFSDDELASRFSGRHADELRHVAKWGQWLRWDGTRWCEDSTLMVFDLARLICREAASECNIARTAKAIAAAKTIAAIERLAKADRRHATDAANLDHGAMLLNTGEDE